MVYIVVHLAYRFIITAKSNEVINDLEIYAGKKLSLLYTKATKKACKFKSECLKFII